MTRPLSDNKILINLITELVSLRNNYMDSEKSKKGNKAKIEQRKITKLNAMRNLASRIEVQKNKMTLADNSLTNKSIKRALNEYEDVVRQFNLKSMITDVEHAAPVLSAFQQGKKTSVAASMPKVEQFETHAEDDIAEKEKQPRVVLEEIHSDDGEDHDEIKQVQQPTWLSNVSNADNGIKKNKGLPANGVNFNDQKQKSTSPIVQALLDEHKRLVRKECAGGIEGFFWRSRYQDKAKKLAAVMGSMNLTDKSIMDAVNDTDSALYQALNTHSSYVFKFTAKPASLETRAVLNMKKAIDEHKPIIKFKLTLPEVVINKATLNAMLFKQHDVLPAVEVNRHFAAQVFSSQSEQTNKTEGQLLASVMREGSSCLFSDPLKTIVPMRNTSQIEKVSYTAALK